MTSTSTWQDVQKHVPVVGELKVKSPFAYQMTRAAIAASNQIVMGLTEAYINGAEIPDTALKSSLDKAAEICYKYFPSLLVPYEWLLKESDRLAEGSQELMEIQYDLPGSLFTLMLGESEQLYPKYTMALWEKGAQTLEQAQIQMLDDAIEKAEIKDGDEILDLGCGWGSAANRILARFPSAKVTSLNLSHEQCEYIRSKMEDPRSPLSSDRFVLCEQDFNDARFDAKFDKIIAIGLFEHIGNLTQSFRKLASFLKDDGKVFIHIITTQLPENITHPFINQYIFPNMRVWNFDVIPSVNQNLRTVDRWFLNGYNYAKTLSNWLSNFDQHQESLARLDYGMSYAKFRRIWRLYLMLCIAHFEACSGEILGNGQYLLVQT
ncbi:class I SAM-dependent methyltransferase [Leptolyngbya ohadii]|uniref:class I SAM-dependent methyltransferase n=1 Tax=Leptolyngbya ohadii TaxID=1962290 RepID=UPI000B599B3F|nr:class I SAM-dependent methyltransferase [Leptolyngbya ohadii]